jgi:hypothetical protein
LLHRTVFFRPWTGLGQNEPPKHVRVGGGFRRKQPWRPHSWRSQLTLREQGEAGRPAPRWRPASMRFRARPMFGVAPPLSAHQLGSQSHGAGLSVPARHQLCRQTRRSGARQLSDPAVTVSSPAGAHDRSATR